MKARIPKNEYDPNTIGVPKKLIEDKQYAKEFWEYLTQANPESDYGETFEEWYNKLTTLAFAQKINAIDRMGAIKNAAKKNKQKGGG